MTTTTETLEYPILQEPSPVERVSSGFIKQKQTIDIKSAKDYELTKLSAKGDMMAFEEIYNRHHRRVYSICLRMLQNTTEAEDLTQDVLFNCTARLAVFAAIRLLRRGFIA